VRGLIGTVLLAIGAFLASSPFWAFFTDSPDLDTAGKLAVGSIYVGMGLVGIVLGAVLLRRRR